MRDNNTLYYLLGDHLSSTSVTANSNGTKIAELRYKPWGETRYTSGATPTSFQYTGQRNDATGLYFYNARYYDPALGRFLAADSIVPSPGNPQSVPRFNVQASTGIRTYYRPGSGRLRGSGRLTPLYSGTQPYASIIASSIPL